MNVNDVTFCYSRTYIVHIHILAHDYFENDVRNRQLMCSEYHQKCS